MATSFIEESDRDVAEELLKFSCKLMFKSIPKEQVSAVYDDLNTHLPPQGKDSVEGLPELIVGLLDQFQIIMHESTASSDVEGTMQVMSALIANMVTKTTMAPSMVDKFCTAVTSDVNRSEVRLSILTYLFTTLARDSPLRPKVYTALVDFSVKTKLFAAISHTFKSLPTWRKDWSMTDPEYQALLKAVCAAVVADQSVSEDTLATALTFLSAFGDNDFVGEAAEAAEQVAQFACVQAIKLPALFDVTRVLKGPAVARLASSKVAERQGLLQLLKVFANEGVTELIAFHKGQPKVFSQYGLEFSECESKMRILTIGSIGFETSQIGYDDLAQQLACDKDMVEIWAIRALGAGLVEVKLNQVDEVAYISGSKRKVETCKDWEELKAMLDKRRDELESIISILDSFKPQPPQGTVEPDQVYDPEEEGHDVQPKYEFEA